MTGARKWLPVLTGAVFVVLVGLMIFDGTPWWKAALVTLLIITLASVGIVLGLGAAVNRAREFVTDAIELTQQGKLADARRLVLAAVRADGDLMEIPDLHKLYEIIVAGDQSAGAVAEVERIKSAIPKWPKTRREAFFLSNEFHVVLITAVVIIVTMRFLTLFH